MLVEVVIRGIEACELLRRGLEEGLLVISQRGPNPRWMDMGIPTANVRGPD